MDLTAEERRAVNGESHKGFLWGVGPLLAGIVLNVIPSSFIFTPVLSPVLIFTGAILGLVLGWKYRKQAVESIWAQKAG